MDAPPHQAYPPPPHPFRLRYGARAGLQRAEPVPVPCCDPRGSRQGLFLQLLEFRSSIHTASVAPSVRRSCAASQATRWPGLRRPDGRVSGRVSVGQAISSEQVEHALARTNILPANCGARKGGRETRKVVGLGTGLEGTADASNQPSLSAVLSSAVLALLVSAVLLMADASKGFGFCARPLPPATLFPTPSSSGHA